MTSQEGTVTPSPISTNTSSTDKDVTEKDIANLYSRLQSVMHRTHQEAADAKFIPLPASLPLSPSVSSSGNNNKTTSRNNSINSSNSSNSNNYFPYGYADTNKARTPPMTSSPTTAYKPTSLSTYDGTPTGSSSSPVSSSTPTDTEAPTRFSGADTSDTADDILCPCHHILISKDSHHCGLCDRVIPVLEALTKERDTQEYDIKRLQQRLAEEQLTIQDQTNDISLLQASVQQVKKQLTNKTEAFLALQGDMETLNDKYVDEIERVAEIQHSKDMVENELEDLSRRLFEEANGMVANEKREKYNLEVAQKHLENQLKETKDRLAAEQMQLQELRLKMEAMQDFEKNDRASVISDINSSSGMDGGNNHSADGANNNGLNGDGQVTDTRGMKDLAGLFADQAAATTAEDQLDNKHLSPELDTMLLTEFADFVKLRASVPLKKLHSIPFMKHCQLEDVDPCLRFGAHSRLSARKINDAIVMNTCFIEEAPLGFADEQARRPVDVPLKTSAGKSMLWERFSSNSQAGVFAGCQACGRNNGDTASLPYRFRISYFDDWACIDRYCRDRLVAVCEFYVFIRNVRQGYYNSRTITDLYQEAMRLRLQMFYARMGALPWTIRSLGIKGDRIGEASVSNFDIPEPPTSESSPLPRKNSTGKNGSKRGSSLDEKLIMETTSVKILSLDDTTTATTATTATTEAAPADTLANEKDVDAKINHGSTENSNCNNEHSSVSNQALNSSEMNSCHDKGDKDGKSGMDDKDVFLDATDQ
ncbi:hypothetical protein BCR42DRAFT_412881 [Absidia repens]|uniref:GDP/GTP exchange factor Sec2 N-terminal domain-containing protein n=1 Tax=Absidia repens TaxID=90262 RepID=A0A1X2IK76_9FUNG|nr:hypothetical protein BCR42DRAFT_412881 [Absidia repens]